MSNASRLQRQNLTRRRALDWSATQLIRLGGVFVVVAVTLIFLYLLYKVFPLFSNFSLKSSEANYISQSLSEKLQKSPSIAAEQTLYYGVDEYSSILYAVGNDGMVHYVDLKNKQQIPSASLIPAEAEIDRISHHSLITQLPFDRYAIKAKRANDDGLETSEAQVFIVEHQYSVSYPNNVRTITPDIVHPWGENTLSVAANTKKITIGENDDYVKLAAATDNAIVLYNYIKEASLFGDGVEFELESEIELPLSHAADFVLINFDLRWLIVLSKDGSKTFFPLFSDDIAADKQEIIATEGTAITQVSWLLGEISLLIANNKGEIEQWFPVRQKEQKTYQKIRTFKLGDAPITTIRSERLRKGFVATDSQGQAGIFYTSSENHLTTNKVSPHGIVHTVIAPQDEDMFFLDSQHKWHYWQVDNPHPEGNFKQIWQKIHYENYDQDEYQWQSSAANQDFEPKFSLTPLLFGTIKGAFYALLFAIPLAILGAIYTAFFMSQTMRRYVKPTIEIMEALPTVILGFLAGLWMAPFVEKNLMFLCLMLLFVPVGIVIFGFFSSKLATKNVAFLSGNRFMLLIPMLFLFMALCLLLADPIQNWLFDGDIRQYITEELGITYNQRNALVVGFAMGFAVIPTIFSITEDAIYSVPKHLVNGSLAMGASPWQTLIGVVLPTASPAIFSAVMIGLGRAVGETMIVLMATGNTAVMEVNIFEGMRTLSANIAVEMPESEIDSTHFRILFLAALVLFMFTFVFNTIAESIRLRLKKRYAEL